MFVLSEIENVQNNFKQIVGMTHESCTIPSVLPKTELSEVTQIEGNLNSFVTILTDLAFSREQSQETAFLRCWKIARPSFSTSSLCAALLSSNRRRPLEVKEYGKVSL